MHTNRLVFIAAVFLLSLQPAAAETLLAGEAELADGTSVPFSLEGNSREDVTGGSITLGKTSYTITDVSAKNLVGAKLEQGEQVSLAVFSSSYSRVTYTGKPWVDAQQHHGCSGEYNSFLAVYEVAASELAKLPAPPYWQLAEQAGVASSSSVYCFMSKPVDND